MNKSGYMKDALILFVITLIAGLCLGGVYEMTKEPIQEAKMATKRDTYQLVFEHAENFKESDALAIAVKDAEVLLTAAKLDNVLVNEAVEAVDGSGLVIGYVVSATSTDGYGGPITLSVGIDQQGVVRGIEFLEISETPGLGMNATDPVFKNEFKDKAAGSFEVTKNGATDDHQIDALSGATITTNAVVEAVNAALYFVHDYTAQ